MKSVMGWPGLKTNALWDIQVHKTIIVSLLRTRTITCLSGGELIRGSSNDSNTWSLTFSN